MRNFLYKSTKMIAKQLYLTYERKNSIYYRKYNVKPNLNSHSPSIVHSFLEIRRVL